jgi:hypothetical protein
MEKMKNRFIFRIFPFYVFVTPVFKTLMHNLGFARDALCRLADYLINSNVSDNARSSGVAEAPCGSKLMRVYRG